MSHLKKLLVFTFFAFALVPITAYSNTFILDSFEDIVDSNPGDGLCLTSSNECTLRAAIQESNNLAGPHTILLEVGTYRISIPGINDDNSLTGDLDIRANITIEGKGAAKTIINGSAIDRIFDIKDAIVNLKDISLTNGVVTILDVNGVRQPGGLGGGIMVFLGTLTLDNVWVNGNYAGGMGGGIFSLLSNLNLQHSIVYNNNSSSGAGIAAISGTTSIIDSFILYHPSPASTATPTPVINQSGAFMGGGIYNFGNLTIDKSVMYQNTAEVDGGGIYHGLGKLRISNSTIANNVAKRNGGAIYYRMGEVGITGSLSNTPHLTNVSIVNNIALSIDNSNNNGGVIAPGFFPDFSKFPAFNDNSFDPSDILDFTVPDGAQEGGIGGGGIFVAGQFGEGESVVNLTIANSIVAKNHRDVDRNVADDCKKTIDGNVLSYGNNVESKTSCGFTLPNGIVEGTDLKLLPFNISNIVNPSRPGLPPNLTQSQFNKLIPHTQLFEADSPLRNAANDAHCPDDDQRGRTRPVIGCDIGAYEFLPPVASPMQFVVKPGAVVESVFIISDPAEKAVTFEIVSPPTQGNVSQPGGISSPSWSYSANVDATGSDQFTYRACFSATECSNIATIGFKIITEPAVVDAVSIDIVSEIGGSASEVDIVNEADLVAGLEDTDYTFPVGAIFFSVDDIPVESPDSLVVELQLPLNTEIPEDAVVRKLDNTGIWRTLASSTSATESSGVIDPVNKTITLTLLDNDDFDSNRTLGEIRDPVALGVPDKPQLKTEADGDEGNEKTSGSLNMLLVLMLMLVSSVRLLRRK